MELTWFGLIAILWTGYFILEGFDFGVGMLLPILGRDTAGERGENRRRLMLTTIGPHWDGNEVWLITAAGATFAAFPQWYATLFSAFYLPLLIILIALILRGVGLEYRHKRPEPWWSARWDAAIVVGSWAPAVLWGAIFANLIAGLPIDARMNYVGSPLSLVNPAAIVGGLTTTALFLLHGAGFLALKTTGSLRTDARRTARRLGWAAAPLTVLALTVLLAGHPDVQLRESALTAAGIAAGCLAVGMMLLRRDHEGGAFAATSAAIGLSAATLFLSLFPDVMPSTMDPAYSLTYLTAASSPLTLRIMTIAAAVFTPVVLAYTAYSYWVFRRRIGVHQLAGHEHPTRPAAPAGGEVVR